MVTFTWALVLFGVVLAFLDLGPDDGEDPAVSLGVAVAIVAAAGLVSLVAANFIPALDGSSDSTAAQTYRTRFFLRLATAESVALVGFVLCFLTGSIVPYLAALPFTAIGFWRAAPTKSNIQRDQDALRAQGSPVQLWRVLLATNVS